jgi:N-methylhydantoinase B
VRDGEERLLQSKGEFVVQPGDIVSMRAGGGGGAGDPREREREAVLADLRAGRISEASARDVYGLEVEAPAGAAS